MKPTAPATNFGCLQSHDQQLVRLGMLAERYFPDDPNTSILKLRQFAELLAQFVATRVGCFVSREEAQYDLLRRLQEQGILPREVAQLFGEVRRAGNAASHNMAGGHRTALATLKISWQLGLWFHRTFGNPAYKSGPFMPPHSPKDESEELRSELERLTQALADYQATHKDTAERLQLTEAQLREAKDDRAFWEGMAAEAEQAKATLVSRLVEQQASGESQPQATTVALVTAANTAANAVELDEAETRELIDQALQQAGWTANTAALTYAKGVRPEKGKNLAIAEWPTANGPADYVLFAGLTPIAAVEANDAHADLVVQQLKRAFAVTYGAVDDDAVMKITGAADQPLQLIRRFKNERNPNVAVTVDLLTTGIDVPEICNLVFLRRVNSRILFDQMLGRATRLCDDIGKQAFRVFDAVRIYEALRSLTAMQPVVVNPFITFTQLAREMAEVKSDDARNLARDQFVAKLQRKKRHLSEAAARDFEMQAGMSLDAFIRHLRAMPLGDVAAWFTQNPDLGEILDRQGGLPARPVFVSEHADSFQGN